MNYIGGRIELINKAIYSDFKKLSFYITEKFMGNSSLHKHGNSYLKNYKGDFIKEIEVEAEPLDAIFDRVTKINFLKIDIEGGEYHALKGMTKLLESGKIETLSFEINKEMLQDDWILLYEFLRKYNEMKYYILNNNGDIISISVDDIFKYSELPNVIIKIKK
ncbi:FkbM family methyltransferase [Thermoanaerobacterium thermosaccharolyticum]|uniref:FkbM family methyltransferase n=1 Tax=Thermoanaerobacterium thermosaccharolyticum TaxID=1517 RepID=UPI003DA89F2C